MAGDPAYADLLSAARANDAAALEASLSDDANVNATIRLLQACQRANVRRIVYSSSSSVYGDQTELPLVETMVPRIRLSSTAADKEATTGFRLHHRQVRAVRLIGIRLMRTPTAIPVTRAGRSSFGSASTLKPEVRSTSRR